MHGGGILHFPTDKHSSASWFVLKTMSDNTTHNRIQSSYLSSDGSLPNPAFVQSGRMRRMKHTGRTDKVLRLQIDHA